MEFTLQQLHAFISSATAQLNWQQAASFAGILPFDSRTFQAALLPLCAQSHPGDLWMYTDGSFTPGSTAAPARAGWAVVCIDPFAQAVSFAEGRIDACGLVYGSELTPYLAECYALMAAAIIGVNSFSHRRCVFLSDCTAALEAAAGRCAHQLEGIPQAMCSAHAFRGQLCGGADLYTYVPGHAGIFGNELADQVAKAGAVSREVSVGVCAVVGIVDFWLGRGGIKPPWAALALRSLAGDRSLPALNVPVVAESPHHAGLTSDQLLAPFAPLGALDPPREASGLDPDSTRVTSPADEPLCLTLHLATFNVLSLGKPDDNRVDREACAGLAYQPARAALLAEQLRRHNIHVAFLQETRADSGQSGAGPYLRYASGAMKGQFGTEIWFWKQHPVLLRRLTAAADQFRPEALTVLVADERRLFIRFSGSRVSVLFVALHGPHRAVEQCVVDRWWRETKSLFARALQTVPSCVGRRYERLSWLHHPAACWRPSC